MSASSITRSRLKLLALFSVFALPMAMAWGMVEWRVGIPESRTAHGELHLELPVLSDWPLTAATKQGARDWLLAFDCPVACDAAADRWWRVHRALGRQAHRVSRLRIGGEGEALPGASVSAWQGAPPAWRRPGALWILDPEGWPVLGYAADVDAASVLEDLKRLLRLNPEPPLALAHDDD